MKVTLVLCPPLTRVCAGDGVVGHSMGGDIVLALQGVWVLGDGGQSLRRNLYDLKVVKTWIGLRLIALGTENLESAQEKVFIPVYFLFFFFHSRIVRAAHPRDKERLEADGSSEHIEINKKQRTVLKSLNSFC